MATNNNLAQTSTTPIQTPILKLLLRYFGNLSVQLYSVNRQQPTSLLNFVWNLVLVGSFFYSVATRQGEIYSNQANSIIDVAKFLKKPLFSLLISRSTRAIFPTCFILRVLYFIVLSFKSENSLIQLLDQLSAGENSLNIFKSCPKAFSLFALVVFGHQLLLLLSIFTVLLNLSKYLSLYDIISFYLTLNIMYISINMANLIVLYCKTATLRSLKRAVRRFQLTGNLVALQLEIVRLAYLNMLLNHFVSFPYICGLSTNLIQMLIALTCLVMGQSRDIDVFAVNYLIYTLLIVSLCSAIDGQLLHIQRLISTHLKKKIFKYSHSPNSGKHPNQQFPKWFELMSLYQKCFQLKIYNFFTVNWKFVFVLSIFFSNLVMLISQTSIIS